MQPISRKPKLLLEMPVLYQNKRTAILDCSNNLTHGLEEYSILMWDKFLNLEMGWASNWKMELIRVLSCMARTLLKFLETRLSNLQSTPSPITSGR